MGDILKNYKKFTILYVQTPHFFTGIVGGIIKSLKNFKIIQTNGEIELSLYCEMLKKFLKFAPFYEISVPILLEK